MVTRRDFLNGAAGAMFSEHIEQADEGCDFDYLRAGGSIPEPEIH